MASDVPFNTDSIEINSDSTNQFYNFSEEDPAAEFLQREKRELGDITGNGNENYCDDLFSTQMNHNDRSSPFKNGSSSVVHMYCYNEAVHM
jgi:hypothetical protein